MHPTADTLPVIYFQSLGAAGDAERSAAYRPMYLAKIKLGCRIVAAALIAVAATGCGIIDGAFTDPDDVQIADPARAVADARRLIAEQRANPDRDRVLREPNELPESLRLPGLRYALVHEDHLDLVLARNPDWNIGARIWSADAKRRHADQPTKYTEVFFYRYTNDEKESADNIL